KRFRAAVSDSIFASREACGQRYASVEEVAGQEEAEIKWKCSNFEERQRARIAAVKGTLTLETNLESVHSTEGEQWVSLDGVRVRYLRSGSGPPLVLMHASQRSAFYWRSAVPGLAHHATVYA